MYDEEAYWDELNQYEYKCRSFHGETSRSRLCGCVKCSNHQDLTCVQAYCKELFQPKYWPMGLKDAVENVLLTMVALLVGLSELYIALGFYYGIAKASDMAARKVGISHSSGVDCMDPFT